MTSVNISVGFALTQIINLSHWKLLWAFWWNKVSKYLENIFKRLWEQSMLKSGLQNLGLRYQKRTEQNRAPWCEHNFWHGESGRKNSPRRGGFHFIETITFSPFLSNFNTVGQLERQPSPALTYISHRVHSLIPQRYD